METEKPIKRSKQKKTKKKKRKSPGSAMESKQPARDRKYTKCIKMRIKGK